MDTTLTYKCDDSTVTVTHHNDTLPIDWPDILLAFADVLNAAGYSINRVVLNEHLTAAAEEMRSDSWERISNKGANYTCL